MNQTDRVVNIIIHTKKNTLQSGSKILAILTIILLVCSLSNTSCTQKNSVPHKILVIQSYEPDYFGYEKINTLIKQAFTKNGLNTDIHTFYMDCELYRDPKEQEVMYDFLDSISSWEPEIILVKDDQATYDLLACGHPLAKKIPVVFTGVNFPNWKLINQYSNVTGFQEKITFLPLKEMVEHLYGHSYIRVWFDNTFLGKKSGWILLNEIKATGQNKIGNHDFKVNENGTFWIDSTFKRRNIATRPPETRFARAASREASVSSFMWELTGMSRYSVFVHCKRDYSTLRLGNFAARPTFSVINEGFGENEGILGGHFTPIETEIELAVGTIKDILQGKNIKDIPIRETPKQFMIDWKEMQRWHIPKSALSLDYHIINMPFHEQYKAEMIGGGLLFCLLIISAFSYLTYLYRQENHKKQIAQKNLKTGEQFLSLALAGGNVFAFRVENEIFYFDKDFYLATGLHEEPITLAQFKSYLHPDDKEQFCMNIKNAYAGTLTHNINQARYLFNNSSYNWWESRYNYNMEDNTFNGLFLNIQKSKENEQELISARRKAEESDMMKSAFLANMSHEIRTPLNAIIGFSNLIVSGEAELTADEKNNFLQLINTNSDLLLKLINDILDLSRIESGRMSFSFVPCNLTKLINEIFGTHQVLMPDNVVLMKETPETEVTIETDPLRLTQVITNFINNARKFTKEGYIKIGYKKSKNNRYIDIFVEDTGIGIPKEHQQAIFERFNKLNEFAQGTGLGLAICQVIIKRFGGEIRLQSEKGKGSRFTIALPL